MTLPYAIMAFVTLQRLSELVIARRNTARLMAAERANMVQTIIR